MAAAGRKDERATGDRQLALDDAVTRLLVIYIARRQLMTKQHIWRVFDDVASPATLEQTIAYLSVGRLVHVARSRASKDLVRCEPAGRVLGRYLEDIEAERGFDGLRAVIATRTPGRGKGERKPARLSKGGKTK